MIEVTVAHLGLDRSTNTPVVILREKEGARVLPIWIGPAEASASESAALDARRKVVPPEASEGRTMPPTVSIAVLPGTTSASAPV